MSDYVELRLHPEERLRLIEENVRDYVIFVVDPEGKIASWNRGAERVLGYSEQEAVGMDCREIFTPEDRALGAVEAEREKARTTGRAEDERWHLRKGNVRFWGSGIMTALKDADGSLRGYAKIMRDETLRKVAEDGRIQAEEERLEQERRNAVLQERNRIAQEIHDTLAQSLTAIHLQMEAAKDHLSDESNPIRIHIERAQDLARQGLAETRRSVRALRPQLLERNGLIDALQRMAEEVRVGASLDVHCAVHGHPFALFPAVEDQLLRISQEAVTNILRHADATTVELVLRFEPDRLFLEIRDDGQGFDPLQARKGFGLLGMRERAESIGGRLVAISEPGKGTRIAVSAPRGRGLDGVL
jgi:PAS domain S-box-containing protein